MSRRRRRSEEEPGVPTWIVSFSDMITLLLSFFVLLQVFAHDQDPELFFIGQGSFRRALSGMGIPDWLFGKPNTADHEYRKPRFPAEQERETLAPTRVVDEQDEIIRKLFADIRRLMETETSELRESVVSVSASPIRFTGADTRLDEAARRYLRTYAGDLRQNMAPAGARVYVVGLDDAPNSEAQAWLRSAQRALAVEEFLRELLAPAGWETSSWGAGDGGAWRRTLGVTPEQCDIVLAVMREN